VKSGASVARRSWHVWGWGGVCGCVWVRARVSEAEDAKEIKNGGRGRGIGRQAYSHEHDASDTVDMSVATHLA